MRTVFPTELIFNEYGSAREGTILFLHANSYSAKLYRPFLEPFRDDYEILSPDLPGHGDSRWSGRIQNWNDLADYYIEMIDKNPPQSPLVGMGHSIGGVLTLIMAIKRPQWFSKIILLDPVMLPRRILWVIRVLRIFSLTHLVPLAKTSKRRKQHFPSLEAALEHYSNKAVFAQWQPEFRQAYVDTCIHATESGQYQLSCAPELESSIYQSIPLQVWSLPKKLTIPSLFIIGENSDTVNQHGLLRLKRLGGNHVVKSIDGGHLFPFEKPARCIDMIKEFLAE